MEKEHHKWTIIGLNETEAHVEINGLEYRMEKSSVALIHAIMCLVDTMEEIGEKIHDLHIAIERRN